MPNDLIYLNGIDGTTGTYLTPPMAVETLARIAAGETWNDHIGELTHLQEQKEQGTFALTAGRDPKDLASAGWGLIMPAAVSKAQQDAILDALTPLRDFRKERAGPLYKEFIGPAGYRAGESKSQFLSRRKLADADRVGYGPVDPTRVPYYLLLVGDPESIPYDFQYELDIQYAVGRICFRTLDEYASYAASVVAAEAGKVARSPRGVFFGVANPNDPATKLSSEFLIPPLAEKFGEALPPPPDGRPRPPDWKSETVAPAEATKSRLRTLLGGADTPAFLFTAGHGMGFPYGDQKQFSDQGALLCQDWPGPGRGRAPVSEEHYLAAHDITADATPAGLIAFFFACYGGGTPYWDDYARQAFRSRAAIAPRAFTAALPMRLLGHPKGGALAVVGHIERAWGYSIRDQWVDQVEAFRSALHKLKEGHPIGSAMDDQNGKYTELAATLTGKINDFDHGAGSSLEVAGLWTANNDARGYAVFGDPAVKLAVPAGAGPGPAPRPEPIVFQARGKDPLPDVLAPGAPRPGAGPAARAPTYAPMAGEGAVPMGLPGAETFGGIRDGLTGALRALADRVSNLVTDLASLEVTTYAADSLDQVTYDPAAGRFTGGAKLRALSRVSLDGDVQTCVPTAGGQLDQAMLDVHQKVVAEAQKHRAAMLKAVAELLTGWVRAGAGG